MTNKIVAAALTCLLLSGCSHPFVKLDPITFQSKVEEVTDWDALAERQAEQAAFTLARAGTSPTSVDGFVLPGSQARDLFYIEAGTSKFAQSFKPLLEKHLLRRGLRVMQTPAPGAWVLKLDAKTFLYDPTTATKHPVQYATFWTTAYTLGVLARDVSSIDTGAFIAVTAGPLVDMMRAINDRTNAEVLLVITAADQQRVYYHSTESFYVRPTDLRFYWPDNQSSLPVVSLPVRGL
jgi:hypothetical protein